MAETGPRTSTVWLYALPGLALAMPTIPAYVMLPAFYAETVGLGLALTGAVMLAARLFDMVTDPLVGFASDRLRLPGGRRKPWIAAGALLAGVALLQLFTPPDGAGWSYLLAWSVALYLGWTLVQVPYTALGAELDDDYVGRARITGAREGMMVVGILIAGAIPVIVTNQGGDEAAGLRAVAWAACFMGALALPLMLWRVAEPRQGIGETGISLKNGAKAVWHNKPFLRLFLGWFVNGLANGIPAALFPLYLSHALQVDDGTKAMLIFAYFLAAVLAIPLWVKLCGRFAKHRVWCAAMIVACLAFVTVPLIDPQQVWLFAVVCVITGAALGADLALPPAMQADVVDLDKLRTGENRTGLYFAFWSMGTKLALAAGVGFGFPALDAFGFDAAGTNTEAAIWALIVIYALVPVVFKMIAIAIIWGHPLDARAQAIVQKRLSSRSAPKTDRSTSCV